MARKANPQNQQIRRDQILSAAAQVFALAGYPRATTKKIAEAAGVSEGLLYTYFDSKESLLVETLNLLTQSTLEHLSKSGQDLLELVEGELAQTLTRPRVDNAVFAAVLSEVLVNPGLRHLYRQQRLEVFMARLKTILEQRMEAGDIALQDVDILTRALSALVLGLGILRIVGDPVLQPENPKIDLLVETIGQFILKGLA